jgi:hypothetical protein
LRRSSKKDNKAIKFLIIMATISVLSFTGVSYAYWTDSVQIIAKASTGNIKAVFSKADRFILDNRLQIQRLGDLNTDLVNFKILSGFDVLGGVGAYKFEIKNNGSIPIKVMKDIKVNFDNYPNGHLKFELSYNEKFSNEEDEMILSNNDNIIDKGQSKIVYFKISVIEGIKDNCTVEIPYVQFNAEENESDEYSGWNKSLKVRITR